MRVGRLLGAGAGASAPTIPLTTPEAAPLSRRQLLTGLAILGAGAAAGGAASTVATGLTAEPITPSITNPAADLTRLQVPNLRLHAAGQEPGRLPPLDATLAGGGAIRNAAGAPVGSFATTPVPGAFGGLQLHTFELEGGTLLGMGVAKAGEGAFAIVGGTGRYEGATGSYTVRVSRDPGTRRANAEFTFKIAGE